MIILQLTYDGSHKIQMTIRPSTPQDLPAIHGLILELAAFENGLDRVHNTLAQMEAEQDCFQCLVAEDKSGTVVGMALFYPVYYTWIGKTMYLDDLYVQSAYRGQGLGMQLLEGVFAAARAAGCKHVRWQVLDWNTPAIALYERIGARLDGEWINCMYSL
jgi:GNAT superfamily N-acetyltransferase